MVRTQKESVNIQTVKDSLAFLERETRQLGLDEVSLLLRNTYCELENIRTNQRERISFREIEEVIIFLSAIVGRSEPFLKRLVDILDQFETKRMRFSN